MIRQNWQMFSKAVSDTIVDDIIKIAGKTMEASTFNNSKEDIRKSRVAWIKDKRILNLLYDYVDMSNRNVFKVHIYKKADIQFTEYLATEGGHYNWHHDIDWNRNDGLDRKLSVTVQLSSPAEYEGGDFSFNECESPTQSKEKGTVLIFPSYLQHKINPVTKGIRRSLVAWFEGPKWV
tara:strand:+ start:696 stop:1229 length:534 start_codon:yes stop_codon:yes gene_type:complete